MPTSDRFYNFKYQNSKLVFVTNKPNLYSVLTLNKEIISDQLFFNLTRNKSKMILKFIKLYAYLVTSNSSSSLSKKYFSRLSHLFLFDKSAVKKYCICWIALLCWFSTSVNISFALEAVLTTNEELLLNNKIQHTNTTLKVVSATVVTSNTGGIIGGVGWIIRRCTKSRGGNSV